MGPEAQRLNSVVVPQATSSSASLSRVAEPQIPRGVLPVLVLQSSELYLHPSGPLSPFPYKLNLSAYLCFLGRRALI